MKFIVPSLILFAISITSIYGQNFSLHFDGDDDYAVFPACEAQTFPSFTIEGWFKCEPSNDPQVIFMSFLDISQKNANVTLEVRENGLLRFNFRSVATDLGGNDYFSTTVVDDNVWHHFAVVKEGSEKLWLYIDGFPDVIDCGSFPAINAVPIFEVGRNRYDPAENYRQLNGHVDDLKIWNRAKNCRDIFTEYKSESAGVELGLYSNYKFDTNSDTVFDCSPFKRHGLRKGTLGANNLPQFSPIIPSLIDKMCEFQFVGVQDEFINQGTYELALISPNPVSEILKLELTEHKDIRGQIYTSDGRLVRSITFTEKMNSIDVSALPAGTYLIKLSNAEITETKRFIKI